MNGQRLVGSGQLRLDILALGDVANEAMPQCASIGLTLRQRTTEQPALRAVVKLDPVLLLPGRLVGSRLLDCDHHGVVIVWMNDGK